MFLLLGVKKEAQKEKGQKGTTQANPLKHGIVCQGYVSPQKAKGYAHLPKVPVLQLPRALRRSPIFWQVTAEFAERPLLGLGLGFRV